MVYARGDVESVRVGEVVRGRLGHLPQASKLLHVLSDPSATVVIVEHWDLQARFAVGQLEAALAAQGRRIVVAARVREPMIWCPT